MTEILFEKGDSTFEKFIIGLQQFKAARLMVDVPCFSHCSIKVNNLVWQTHPAKGVTREVYKGGLSDTRQAIKLELTDIQEKNLIDAMNSQLSINKHDKKGAVLSGIMMVTGLWLGKKNRELRNCQTFVAYSLFKIGLWGGNWYKTDILDLYLKLNT